MLEAHTNLNKSNRSEKRRGVRKKQEVIDRRKAEAISEKRQRDRKGDSLSIEDDRYYDSETSADPDQEDGLNPLGDD